MKEFKDIRDRKITIRELESYVTQYIQITNADWNYRKEYTKFIEWLKQTLSRK
jgi:hypothetical protein